MAISAQGATLTLGGTVMGQVAEYVINYSARTPGEFGTVRVSAFVNNAMQGIRTRLRLRLQIVHSSLTVFDGWVVANGVRIRTVTNDIVRYDFEFRILWYPNIN